MDRYFVRGQVLYCKDGKVTGASKVKTRILTAMDRRAAINEFLYLEAGLKEVKFKGACEKAINSFDRNNNDSYDGVE